MTLAGILDPSIIHRKPGPAEDQPLGQRAAGTGQDQTSDRQSLKLGRMDGSFRLPKFSFIRSWLAVVSVLAGLTARGRADIVPLTRLTDASARCMDGTLAGFYHQRATDAASAARWVIHMQGGGECVDSVQCARRFNSSLASSNFFPDYINLTYDPAAANHTRRAASSAPAPHQHLMFFPGSPSIPPAPGPAPEPQQHTAESSFKWDKQGWWLCDDSAATNPEFHSWHHVWIPYCSGDLWSGQKLVPTTLPMPDGANGSDVNVSVYFSGHRILGAVLEALDDIGLDDAELIVVSGNSAGGLGMWLSIDYINERYDNPRVVGVSIAGFYSYSFPYTGPGATASKGLADFRESAWPSHVRLWDSYMNKRCLKANKAHRWACMLANYSYPYVVTPVFIAEALTDSLQLDAHNQLPAADEWGPLAQAYIKEFSANMSAALQAVPVLSKDVVAEGAHGVFGVACFIHDDFTFSSPLIGARNFKSQILAWLSLGDNVTRACLSLDTCGVMCNPSCSAASLQLDALGHWRMRQKREGHTQSWRKVWSGRAKGRLRHGSLTKAVRHPQDARVLEEQDWSVESIVM